MAFSKPKWLKAGFLGFAGSGKTYTAIDMAAWLHKKIGCKRPLQIFDSEGGFDYQVPRIVKLTGHEPDGVQAQSFADLCRFIGTIKAGDIVLIDSITHPWRELLDACFAKKGKGLPGIMAAKDEWSRGFTKWFLTSASHVIICGRAGYEFDYEEIDGKKQLVKTNTKMKTEGELGFEPSLLIEMERRDRQDGTIQHVAIVKKDRFALIDGKIFTNPTGETFSPHMNALDLGKFDPPTIDVTDKTANTLNSDGNSEWAAMMQERKIIIEEIEGDLTSAYPGQAATDKKAKVDLIEAAFGTKSWTALEREHRTYTVERLREGRKMMQAAIEAAKETK